MAHKRIDSNQNEIVQALRKVGATVQSLASVGKGCPDLLVGYQGRNFLFEVKVKNERYTLHECVWDYNWRGVSHRISCPEEALKIVGALK